MSVNPAKGQRISLPKVHRTPSGWDLRAIGVPATSRTFHDLMPSISAHL